MVIEYKELEGVGKLPFTILDDFGDESIDSNKWERKAVGTGTYQDWYEDKCITMRRTTGAEVATSEGSIVYIGTDLVDDGYKYVFLVGMNVRIYNTNFFYNNRGYACLEFTDGTSDIRVSDEFISDADTLGGGIGADGMLSGIWEIYISGTNAHWSFSGYKNYDVGQGGGDTKAFYTTSGIDDISSLSKVNVKFTTRGSQHAGSGVEQFQGQIIINHAFKMKLNKNI